MKIKEMDKIIKHFDTYFEQTDSTPTQEIIELDKSWEKDLHKPNFLLIKVRK